MALSELNGLQSGRLTVGAIHTFLNTVVPVTVGAFSRDYPGVVIEVRELEPGRSRNSCAAASSTWASPSTRRHTPRSRPNRCSTNACCWWWRLHIRWRRGAAWR